MKPWTSSIRRQLLSWLLIPILSLWVVGALITYIAAIDFANHAYDDALLDSAHAVCSRISFQNGTAQVDMPPAAQSILKWNEKDDFFYQVVTSSRALISGDDTVPPPNWSHLSKEATYRDAHIGRHEVRIATMTLPIPDRPNNDFVIVQVAETLQGREELTDKILLWVVVPQLLLIILAALTVWLGVARGLAPLRALQRAVESRNPADLRPLDFENVPKEVKPLLNSINSLLSRLREDREAQRRFVANAAHQLRTPLAGLKTQTELADRLQDAESLRGSLKHIKTSADRATRLVHQLLALARVEPSAMAQKRSEPVDLNAVARQATTELVPLALKKEIDLGFEGLPVCNHILGDSQSLLEMVVNLIENAIIYTQPGGKVTVRIEDGDHPSLIVEDNGPGIPESERERVFERFYRALGNGVDGSGLGLAIVREIADAHGAAVSLRPGPEGSGTAVAVQFPKTQLQNGPITKSETSESPTEPQYLKI